MNYSDSNTNQETSPTRGVVFITWIGMLINILLAGLKLFAGIVGHSQVLVADAVHSLSDLSTDIAILIGVRFWWQPPDEEHPHGHTKIETLVTLLIGCILVLIGSGLARSAVESLMQMMAGARSPAMPGWLALIAALLSIVIKEILYQVTARAGRKAGCTALLANAWHHRSDALSSIPAAIAVAGCMFFGEKYIFLDQVGTIVVSCMIIVVAMGIIRPALATLLDAGASREKVEAIRQMVGNFPQVRGVHKIRTRLLGCGNIAVDLHVQVDPQMEVMEAHRISHQIQTKLYSNDKSIIDVTVHVEPWYF